MLISDLEQVIDDVFNQEEGVVKSVDTVYESSKDGYKLVISIHGLVLEDISVIHTKLIFKVDKEKRNVILWIILYQYQRRRINKGRISLKKIILCH